MFNKKLKKEIERLNKAWHESYNKAWDEANYTYGSQIMGLKAEIKNLQNLNRKEAFQKSFYAYWQDPGKVIENAAMFEIYLNGEERTV